MHGHVVPTMATGVSHISTCVKYGENGKSTSSVFEEMVIKIPFSHNTATLSDLIGLILGYDQGYDFRDFL